jgi:putative peptide zinc metalloprotease protein
MNAREVSLAQEPAPAPQPVSLPRLREDLRLMSGPAHRDGSPSWRIQDPMRNAFFEIGWLEFELLTRCASM